MIPLPPLFLPLLSPIFARHSLRCPAMLARLLALLLPLLLALCACAPELPGPNIPWQRFQKLAADGRQLGLSEGPWRCVADQQTGLVWEVKQANEGPQFDSNSYSWFDGQQGSARGGSCAVDQAGMPFMAYQACDTRDLLQHLNQRAVCGYRDWRLPAASELRSILFKHGYPGETAVPFPLLSRITYGPYWTADWRASGNAGLPEVLSIHVGTRQEGWISSQRVAYMMAVRGAVKPARQP